MGTADGSSDQTGLLIVSGGNEIRSGAHSGMARLARKVAEQGYPVFRYDRRGVGESEGENAGFAGSEAEIVAATDHFRKINPNLTKIIGFGNCDAATSLALFSKLDGLILANPWVIEPADDQPGQLTVPPPAAIRARYWERLKDPRTLMDALSGKIDFRKFATGLRQASQKQNNSALSIKLRDALDGLAVPCRVLLAKRDTTARAYLAAWNSAAFKKVREKPNIAVAQLDSASHGFADNDASAWLEDQVLEMLIKA